MECQDYYCALDKTLTMKFKAKSGSCDKAVLKDVLVQCLYCSEFRDANTIADHIEKEHSSSFEEESSGTPNAVQNKEELYSSKVFSDLKLHSSRDKDPELLNPQQSTPPEHVGDIEKPKCATSTKSENTTCRHCGRKVKDIPNHLAVCYELPATCPYCHDEIRKKDMKAHVDQCDRESKEARKEHENTCQDRITECENHEGALPEKDFEPHCSELCRVEHRNERAAKLRVQEEDDDKSKNKELYDEIQELKDKIKVLEGRLEKLEKPLRKIIKRLSENR